MNALRDFAVSFCTVCAVMGALYMLVPSGAAQRAVKYLFSLIIVICVISALPGLKSIRASLPQTAAETEISEEMRITAARLTFETALQSAGIEFDKITVWADKSDDGSIKITKVTVASSDNGDKIREILGGDDAAYTVEIVS